MEKRKKNTEGGVVKNEKKRPEKRWDAEKGGVVKNGKTGRRRRCAALELLFRVVARGIALS
jgi:hypothetical protein